VSKTLESQYKFARAVGEQICLVELLGRGGMGEVWRATRKARRKRWEQSYLGLLSASTNDEAPPF
jgi:hypothetical protein